MGYLYTPRYCYISPLCFTARRRLEKNHDGIRSAATRQHYIQIYQAMKYLSLDIADFIEKGPQLAELPSV